MQRKKLLHKFIKDSSDNVLHKKTSDSLAIVCDGLLKSKKLSVTAIGREIEGQTTEKHNIKRVDRLVSNSLLENNKQIFYKHLCKEMVQKSAWCIILVDTSCLTADSEFQVIRASLVGDGRAYTLYEMVYKNGKLSSIYSQFLQNLRDVLPEEKGRVIIITDAGFHNKWFHLVKKQKWDFIGRVRQEKSYTNDDGETFPCKILHAAATLKPTHHGTVRLSKKSRSKAVICDLYSVKKRAKGRKMKTKLGKEKRGSYSKAFAKGQKEPWILASSLPKSQFTPEIIVRLYSFRMQIEQSFRDLKNSKYGFCFKNTLTRSVRRLSILLLIVAIVYFIAWIVGILAEQKQWHLKCQSNTSKKRTLSLIYLGTIILKSKNFNVSVSDIRLAMKNIALPSYGNIMERQI